MPPEMPQGVPPAISAEDYGCFVDPGPYVSPASQGISNSMRYLRSATQTGPLFEDTHEEEIFYYEDGETLAQIGGG